MLDLLWPTLKGMPGEVKLLDTRQVDCERFELRSVMLPQGLMLRYSVLALMQGLPPFRNEAQFFLRGVCDSCGEELIRFVPDETQGRKALEIAYEKTLKDKAEKESKLDKEIFLLLLG